MRVGWLHSSVAPATARDAMVVIQGRSVRPPLALGQEHITKLIGCALRPPLPLAAPTAFAAAVMRSAAGLQSPFIASSISCTPARQTTICCAIREGNQPRVLCALHCMARSRRQGSVLADAKERGGFAWWSARTSTVDRARCAKSWALRFARVESALLWKYVWLDRSEETRSAPLKPLIT